MEGGVGGKEGKREEVERQREASKGTTYVVTQTQQLEKH